MSNADESQPVAEIGDESLILRYMKYEHKSAHLYEQCDILKNTLSVFESFTAGCLPKFTCFFHESVMLSDRSKILHCWSVYNYDFVHEPLTNLVVLCNSKLYTSMYIIVPFL